MKNSGKFASVNNKANGGKIDRLIKMLLISIWEALARIALFTGSLTDRLTKRPKIF